MYVPAEKIVGFAYKLCFVIWISQRREKLHVIYIQAYILTDVDKMVNYWMLVKSYTNVTFAKFVHFQNLSQNKIPRMYIVHEWPIRKHCCLIKCFNDFYVLILLLPLAIYLEAIFIYSFEANVWGFFKNRDNVFSKVTLC